MFRKMLLATDGSETALKATQVAADLARRFEGEVLAVYVHLPIPVLEQLAAESGERLMWAGSLAALHGFSQAGQDILARAAAELERAGAPYTLRLERGHPAERICELAVSEGCDTIVIGRQGANRAMGLPMGATSDQVYRCASATVVIVD